MSATTPTRTPATDSRTYALRPGAEIGRYQIIRGLARGGMGEVYLARMTTAGGYKLVALKRMLPTHMDDPDVRGMFIGEANVALRLDHGGVVQVLDVVDIDGEHAIVMEYVHGRSARDLARAWAGEPGRSMGAALAIVIGTAQALHYVHEARDEDGRIQGLVHRDVSPENIMVRFDGGTKLIDFGIARVSAKTSATAAGVLKGKVGYMSPEQIRQDPLDRRSDVFQLGIVLYELTTGYRAFEGENFAAVMNAVLSGETPSPCEHAVDYPPALAEIVERALAYEPEDRYSTADAFANALMEFASSMDIDAGPSVASAELERLFGTPTLPRVDSIATIAVPSSRGRRSSRRPMWLLLVGCALGIGAAAAGLAAGAQADLAAGASTESAVLQHHQGAQMYLVLALGGGLLGAIAVAGWRWRRSGSASVAAVALTTVGCGSPEVPCDDARVCDLRPDGYCDATARRCVYPDDECPSGARFSVLAGESATACLAAVEPPEPTLYAWKIDTPVAIDGDPGELQLGEPLRLRSEFGVNGDIWVRWNDEGLILGAVVTDPQVEATRRSHEPLWDEDGVEVMFDTAWDRAPGPMPGADDFKFVVTAINASSTSWGGIQPRTAWGLAIQSAVVVRGTTNQGADVDDGYSLELRVPWSPMFPKPAPGIAWGMNVRINDHTAEETRGLTWQTASRLNHPSGAGVLGFAGQHVPGSLAQRNAEVDPREPFAALSLADLAVSDSENFAARQPVDRLFDGCLGTRPGCAAGTESDETLWVRFDLGAVHELGSARLFGDTRHEWVSREWSLRYRADDGPWQVAFADRSAYVDGWVFLALHSIHARWVEVAVRGDPGQGAEAAELELYGRPIAGSKKQ